LVRIAEETNGKKESNKCEKERKGEIKEKFPPDTKRWSRGGGGRTVEGGKQENILLNEDV
jgi:hypothetical protein